MFNNKNNLEIRFDDMFRYFKPDLRLRLNTEAEFETRLFYEKNNIKRCENEWIIYRAFSW